VSCAACVRPDANSARTARSAPAEGRPWKRTRDANNGDRLAIHTKATPTNAAPSERLPYRYATAAPMATAGIAYRRYRGLLKIRARLPTATSAAATTVARLAGAVGGPTRRSGL